MTLRLLTDESVNGAVTRALMSAHDVVRAVDEGLSGRIDPEVAAHAASLGRMVVTEDRGFPSHIQGMVHPGIIVLGYGRWPIDAQITRTIEVLNDLADLFAGQVTVVRRAAVRRGRCD